MAMATNLDNNNADTDDGPQTWPYLFTKVYYYRDDDG